MMMPEVAGVPSELARPGETVAEGLGGVSAELQRTCLAVLRDSWSTLAVVATDPSIPAHDLANAFVSTARAYRLAPVRVLDGVGANAVQVARLLEGLEQQRDGSRTVIAVDDPLESPTRIPLVFAADAVVLVVRLGASTVRSVEATAELVGRDRIVGCVVVSR